MKNKETLEEAAFNFTADKSIKEICSRMDFVKGSKFGAKWQQEQNKNLYSEEEVYTLLNDALWDLSKMGYNQKNLDEWFEQFKKK